MKRRAFSQIEVLVAVAVLSVGLLALFAAFSYSLRVTRYAEERAEAASLNQRLIEWVRAEVDFKTAIPGGLKDAADERRTLNAAPLNTEAFSPGELQKYRRNLNVTRVSNDPNDYRFRLWHIKASLYWDYKGSPRSCVFEAYHRQP